MKAVPFVAVWLIGAGAVIWAGSLSNPFTQFVRGIPPPHPYPYSGVAWVVACISAEVMLAFAIIRPDTFNRSLGRACGALIVAAVFFILGLASSMHAPPYITAYLWWLLAAFALVLLLLVFAVVGRLMHRAQLGTPADVHAAAARRHERG